MIASGEHSFPSKPRRGCADEERTHEGLKAHLRELVDPKIAEPVQSGAPRPPPRAARDFAMSGQYPAISCNSSLFAANGEPGTSPSPAAARLAPVPKPGSTRSCPTSDRGGASLVKRRPLALAPPCYRVEPLIGRVLIFWMPLCSTNARNCHHVWLCAQRTQRAVPATPGSSFGNRSTGRFPATPHIEKRRQKIQGKLIWQKSRWARNLRETTVLKKCCVDPYQSHCRRRVELYPSHERRDG
jgi:hypothetical protein